MNKPNPKSKTKEIHWKASDYEEEAMIVNFKKLSLQDANSETDAHSLFKEALSLLFVKHNLDLGGNPQRQLFSFGEQSSLVVEKCKCGKPVAMWALHISSKEEKRFCAACWGRVPMRYDVATWHIIRRLDK